VRSLCCSRRTGGGRVEAVNAIDAEDVVAVDNELDVTDVDKAGLGASGAGRSSGRTQAQ
jgi:hypothetical protein